MRHWITACAAIALISVVSIGCQKETTTTEKGGKPNDTKSGDTKTTKVGLKLPAKICGQCGTEAAEGCCETAKEGTMCKCGFAEGSFLCCSGIEKIDGAYCGKCGAVAGSETCCKGEACEKCGLHAKTALCCKLKSEDKDEEHAGHDHKDGDEHKDGDHDHKEGDKDATDKKEDNATKTETKSE